MEIEEYYPRRALWPWLAGAVVVVGLVFGFFYWTLNSSAVKVRLIEAVQRATGRTLTISGATRFKLSWAPTVSLEDVALANPPGYSRPSMVTVGRLEVGLSLLPLLRHRVEIDHVTLVRPDVLLETNSAGRGNWLFSRGSTSVAGAAAAAPASSQTAPVAPSGNDAGPQWLASWFTNVSVTDGHFGWLDGPGGHHHEARLPVLTLDAPAGGPIGLTGAVSYDGRTVNLSGHAEPTELADSAPGSGPWPVALKLETGDATVTVDGQVDQPMAFRGYTLAIDAEVPDPSIFASWFPGLPLTVAKSISAQAEVSDNRGSVPTVSKAQIKVASVDLGFLGGGATLQNLIIGTRSDGPIRITAGVMWDGNDSGINGYFGDMRWLNDGATGPVTADLEWNAGSARASIKGNIQAPLQFSGFALDVALDVPKPLQVANDAPPALRAVAFQTRLTDAPVPMPFQFTSNAGDVTGQLSVSRLARQAGTVFSIQGQVASQRLDLDMLLARPSGATFTPAATGSPAGPGSGPGAGGPAADKLLIPNTRLPFDLLRAIDANIKVAFADVRFHGVDIRKIDSVAVLTDGHLSVDPFSIAAPDQRMSGKLTADATKTPPTVHLKINAPALAVQPLLGTLGIPQFASGTAQIQADLTGSGETPHAIAASLDGWAGVAMEGGQLDTKMMNAWLNQVQPLHFSGPDTTELRCFALRADLKSGIATIEPVALNTPVLIVDGNGEVDLGHETLTLQAKPRTTIGNTGIAVPVRLSGPIREPSAKIDISAKALGRGGLAGLLLGGKDMMGAAGGGDPCPTALARARETAPSEAGAPVPTAKP